MNLFSAQAANRGSSGFYETLGSHFNQPHLVRYGWQHYTPPPINVNTNLPPVYSVQVKTQLC